ncbi:MAG: hypothetical protein U0176_00430 [Bacteroidia bacterium]
MDKRSPGSPQLPKSLHEVLSAMGEKQRRVFGQYLNFEPFNSLQRLTQLHELIQSHFFAKSSPKQSWDDALKQAGINVQQLDKLLSYLQLRLDQFLAMQQLSQSPHRFLSYTLEAYNALKVDAGTREKKLRQIRKRISGEPQSTEQLQQLINLELFAIPIRIETHAREEGSYYAELNRLIDESALVTELKACCASINESRMRKLPSPDARIRQLRERLTAYPGSLPEIGLAYRAIFELQLSGPEGVEHYSGALDLLTANAQLIDRMDLWDLFGYLLNLCLPRLDGAVPGYAPLVAQIYDQLMALDLLALDGQLQPRMFKNVVSIHCRQGNYDICRRFIRDYGSLLPKEEREVLPQHCLGLVQFYEGQFRQAADSFRQVIQANPEDHFWGLESRSMLLKASFHLYDELGPDELDELMRLVDAFKMYVRRHSQLDAYNRKCYLNFIKFFNQLLKTREGLGDQSRPSLLRAVELEKMVTNKAWLLKVLAEKG